MNKGRTLLRQVKHVNPLSHFADHRSTIGQTLASQTKRQRQTETKSLADTFLPSLADRSLSNERALNDCGRSDQSIQQWARASNPRLQGRPKIAGFQRQLQCQSVSTRSVKQPAITWQKKV